MMLSTQQMPVIDFPVSRSPRALTLKTPVSAPPEQRTATRRGVPVDTLKRAQAGDFDAFTEIVNEFHELVRQTVYRLVSGRFREQVEDITQDIFLRLFRVLPQFDFQRGTKFSSWILTLVKNHCFDVLKKRRLKTVSLTERHGDHRLIDPPALGPDPGRTLESQEIGRLIAKAVDRLPAGQKLVFVLREYQGLSYQEVAEVAGCSEGTVKSRLHRAKETLRDRLTHVLPLLENH